MLRLEGHVAVVTGGARGIGAATCRRLAADGAAVVAVDLDREGAESVVGKLPYGGMGLHCDITDEEEIASTVGQVIDRYGQVDILVNNTGVTRDALFHKMRRFGLGHRPHHPPHRCIPDDATGYAAHGRTQIRPTRFPLLQGRPWQPRTDQLLGR